MQNKVIEAFEKKKFSELKQLPKFRPGDTVEVDFEILDGLEEEKADKKGKDKKADKEKSKARVQSFQGVVIRYKRGKISGSFTVRKIGANGVGVERVFPVCSPHIKELRVLASGVVRRSRLYYLRELTGKAARIRSRQRKVVAGE